MTTTEGDDAGADGEPHRGVRRALSGLRTRAVVAQLVLVVGALAVSVVIIRQVLLVRLDDQIEAALAQEVEELRALAAGVDPSTGEPFGVDVAAVFDVFLSRNVPARDESIYTFVDGGAYVTSFGAPSAVFEGDAAVIERWTSSVQPVRIDVELSAITLRTLAVPLLTADGEVVGTFVVAIDPAEGLAVVSRAVRTMLLITLVVVAVAVVVAWSLAGRVLQPVRHLTRTARGINAGSLTGRIPVSGHDELAELGATFNDMLDRLEGAFRSQREFLDDVAHELRTPITIVRGHLDLLGEDPADRADTLALVEDELDRMGRYVSDLLLVAKAGQPDFLRLDLVDLAEVAKSVYAKVFGLAPRVWTLDEVPRLGTALVVADADRLVQAMLALAANAVQHTVDDTRITIGVHSVPGGDAALWVTDAGPGIDPAEQERIFTRFSRGGVSTAGRPEGTGLGLPIVNAIARAHGGRVELDSVAGRGSTLRLVIPSAIELEGAG